MMTEASVLEMLKRESLVRPLKNLAIARCIVRSVGLLHTQKTEMKLEMVAIYNPLTAPLSPCPSRLPPPPRQPDEQNIYC